jgi:hypothetical protein
VKTIILSDLGIETKLSRLHYFRHFSLFSYIPSQSSSSGQDTDLLLLFHTFSKVPKKIEETEVMNFFNWIRDGVRSAVLLGVSDAVNDIGTPAQGDDIGRRLLEQARNNPTALITEAPAMPDRQPRKKLGRSLEQIQAKAG